MRCRSLLRVYSSIAMLVVAASLAGAQTIGTQPGQNPGRQVAIPKPIGLKCGDTIEAAVKRPRLVVFFAFDGKVGQTVDLALNELSGFAESFAIATVFSPSGEELDALVGNELRSFVLSETGIHRVEVSSPTARGVFTLGMGCPDQGGTPLPCGGLPIPGSIDFPGELDYFEFDGLLDDFVELSLTKTGGFPSSTPRGTLFSPSGALLFTFDADNVVPFTLQETGTYLIRLQANDLIGTGTYNLGLGCIPPSAATILSCGQIPASSSTGTEGELTYFKFDGGVDEIVEIVIIGAGASVPQVRVFTPTGAQVALFTGNSLQALKLTETGSHTIEVRAATLSQTGAFTLALACRDPIGPNTLLTSGATVSSELVAGEVEYYTFAGTALDVAELTLTEASGFPSVAAPQMRVFTPSGADLGSFTADSLNPITLPETGIYSLRVYANTLVDTGHYDITLVDLPPSGVSHIGDDSVTTATIAAAAEVDLFSFDGEANEVVELALVKTAGFSSTIPRGTLLSPTGVNLGTFDANSLTDFVLPETGGAATGNPYTVTIQAANLVATGTYNLGLERRQDPAGTPDPDPQSPPLACGQVIAASIDQAAEVDYYRFDGSSGDVVELTIVKTGGFSSSVPNMRVFSPSGADLGGFNANSLNELTLAETGTYAVRVIANTLVHTGSYSLGLSCRRPVGAVVSDLVCGDVFPSTISVPAEVDYYTFDGEAGDVVEVAIVKTGGFSSSVPQIAVFSPSGAFLGAHNANSLNKFDLVETGTYAVRVTANTLVHTGSYNVGLSCRAPVAPVEDHLVCGEVFVSDLSLAGEVDYYTFDGLTGEVVEIAIAKTGGFSSSVPQIAVFAPSGTHLGSSNANSLTAFTLAEDGVYAVRVTANTYAHAGSYNVGLSCRIPVGAVIEHLDCGEVVESELSVPAEVDYYSFDGQAGDVVEVAIAKTGGFSSSVPQIAVFAPSGAFLGASNANSLTGFTLPETGTYALRVNADTHAHAGSYNVGLSCRIPVGAVIAQLDCGEVVSSELSLPAEVDYYSFDGQAGEVVEVAIAKTGGFPSSVPQIAVFAPSGAFLGASNANSLTGFTLPETGTYALRVNANTHAHAGSYNVGLSCRIPVGAVVAHLDCGDVVASSLSVPAEVDYYSFDGQAGEVVEVAIAKTGGFSSSVPQIAVFAPSGAFLGASNANSLTGFTLPETGTYALRVNANTHAHAGSYNVGLSCRIPVGAVVAHLDCGDVVASSLSVPAEVDYYSFDGQAGDVVEVAIAKTGGFSSSVPQIAVFAPSGAHLGTFNANSLTGFPLTETGTYAVRVNANTHAHAGSYSVGLSCRIPVGAVVEHLDCGEVSSSTISQAAEVDYYTFDGQVNDMVDLTLTKTAGFPSSVPCAAVYTPSGALLGSFCANSTNGYTLPEAGTYAVRIYANTFVHTGSYDIGLSCP